MSADDLADFMVHSVAVETFQGRGATGTEAFGEPYTVPCFLEGSQHLVRGGGGEQILSGSVLYCHPDHAARFAPRSRVTVATPDGQPEVHTRVIVTNVNDLSDDWPEHVEVRLE